MSGRHHRPTQHEQDGGLKAWLILAAWVSLIAALALLIVQIPDRLFA
jgi:hypothetical protein